MDVRISEKTASKIKQKHGLFWDDVKTIFHDEENRLDLRTGETGVSIGVTRSGQMITVFTIRKGNIRWVKTARPMNESEKSIFRREMR